MVKLSWYSIGIRLSQHPYKNLLWRFSSRFKSSSFHTCSSFYLPNNDMLDDFLAIPKCLTTHISYHRFLLTEFLVPSQLRLKATSHKGRRRNFHNSYILASCLGTKGEEGRCLRLITSTFKTTPHHLPTRLGTR